MEPEWANQLYFGDNLDILRRYLGDDTVDLIYLDPPFNSNASYNVLFKEKDGTESAAQITAFDDFWHWDRVAESTYHQIRQHGPPRVGDLLEALLRFLGRNDMTAYLAMMAVRLAELRRVLKPTGSIYLHCDPTASHYLKLVMDAVFGVPCYRNEIVWKRTSGHSDATRCGKVHDVLLYYSKSNRPLWNEVHQPYDEAYVEAYYRYVDDDGRRFKSGDLSAYGLQGGGYEYEWHGHTKVWRCPQATMERLDAEGRIFYTRNGVARLKQYLDEAPGMPLQDVWDDIQPVRSWHKERLGYPTQKPEALLQRVIEASSREGDLVLDPFCGCGTTIVVAERLHRRWIGIDITHVAITLMKNRLHDTFGRDRNPYVVIGEPQDVESARALAEENRHQFQYWALGLVDARPAGEPQKGADRGIDGNLYFFDDDSGKAKRCLLQVKSGHVGVQVVHALKGVAEREQAEMAALITLEEPTEPMCREAVEAGYYEPHALVGPVPRLQILTVAELLSGRKLMLPAAHGNATFRRAPRQRKARRRGG